MNLINTKYLSEINISVIDNQIKINNRQQESIDKLAGKDLGLGSMTYVAQDQKKLIK